MLKKKNTKRSPLVIFSFIALILLSLIILATSIYIFAIEMGVHKNEVANNIEEVVDNMRTNRFVKEQSVEDTLTYILPTGWTEAIDSSTHTVVLLKSEDYKDPRDNSGNGQGVLISFNVEPKALFMTLNEIKRKAARDNVSGITDTKIDNISAIKWEGSNLTDYIVIKGNYLITIEVTEYGNGYTSEISSVIESIKLK